MDAFFVSVEELFDPRSRASRWWWAGGPTSAAWSPRLLRGPQVRRSLRHALAHGLQDVSPGHLHRRHPERYREYSEKVFEVLNGFSPRVEMASIDEAYLEMTGTERLHGRRSRPPTCCTSASRYHRPQLLHRHFTARMVAKVASDQAKPTASCGSCRAPRPRSSPRSMCAGFLESARSPKRACMRSASAKWATWPLDEAFLEGKFGKWGLALAGKSKASTRAAGSIRKSARRRTRSRSATSTPST